MRSLMFALCLVCSMFSLSWAEAERKAEYSHFSLLLPPGWAGDEQTGFVSDNPEEYALTLGIKDEGGDHFLAQISIYLLPNKPGADSETAAKTLAEAQGDATPPVEVGNFWQFEGEPRSRTIKGKGITRVKATPENLLIIIAQDPQNLGAEQILASLKGESDKAKQMLGEGDN